MADPEPAPYIPPDPPTDPTLEKRVADLEQWRAQLGAVFRLLTAVLTSGRALSDNEILDIVANAHTPPT